MAVLVTGGAGYIGSHTVLELLEQGYDVVVLDNLHKGHRQAVAGGTFIQGDLRDTELLDRIFDRYQIDGVLHFAADSLVGESMTEPARYFDNNIVNGLNLLNAMLRHGVTKIVFSSSAAVYGNGENQPLTEDSPLKPSNVYGLTKLQFEEILRAYEQAYGLRFMALRYFNAAGAHPDGKLGEAHSPETHLIPLVLETALGLRRQITVFGTDYPTSDGTCIRDYVHVTDLAAAHILALVRLLQGGESRTYNLGTGAGYSVREVIETARTLTARQIPVEEGQPRPGDPAFLVASAELVRAELGWQPQRSSLQEIILSAWRWHSSHPGGYELSDNGHNVRK